MSFYDIFHRCFPELELGEEVFSELSQIGASETFTCEADGETVGFAAVKDSDLRLLCVLPGYQKRGFGTELFRRARQYAVSNGLGELNVGGRGSGLFIGAAGDSVSFFEKQGCRFSEKVAEMVGLTKKLSCAPYPENAAFGFFSGDREALKMAVNSVESDWVQYFGGGGEVFCGYVGGEIASFCIVDDDESCLLSDGKSRVGSIGCVGTVPKFRRRGIGLKAVSLAADELRRRGCDKIFIHYTAVYDWYARLGFETFLWVHLGKLALK